MYKLIIRIGIIFCLISLPTSIYGQNNYQKYFDQFSVSGSTTIYDYNNNVWIFTDRTDAKRETLPASTFKILNSLIALEEKAVSDENETIPWDGIERSFFGAKMDNWNKETDLKTAFNNSTIWFYEEIAKKVGKRKYQRILEECKYGNLNISEQEFDFWNFGEFAVSPKNQITFLISLYENQLPFSQSSIEKVKHIMISEKNENYIFRDKTGWTKKDGMDIGWWIGYVETRTNVYFFATRLIKDLSDSNPTFSLARKEITKLIMNELKVL